jgi:hypothetical protein
MTDVSRQVELRMVKIPAPPDALLPEYRFFCLTVSCAVPGCGWAREFRLWTARQFVWAQGVVRRGLLERRYLRHLGRAH